MLNDLPNGLAKYAETPVFTRDTVPDKLTCAHETKPGVWGRLIVLEGALDYVVPGPPERRARIAAGEHAVIAPCEPHFVRLEDGARFRVEFHRAERG